MKSLFIIFVLFLFPSPSFATEEYAGQTGHQCSECHVDAAGGGELTKAGEDFLDDRGEGVGQIDLAGDLRAIRGDVRVGQQRLGHGVGGRGGLAVLLPGDGDGEGDIASHKRRRAVDRLGDREIGRSWSRGRRDKADLCRVVTGVGVELIPRDRCDVGDRAG